MVNLFHNTEWYKRVIKRMKKKWRNKMDALQQQDQNALFTCLNHTSRREEYPDIFLISPRNVVGTHLKHLSEVFLSYEYPHMYVFMEKWEKNQYLSWKRCLMWSYACKQLRSRLVCQMFRSYFFIIHCICTANHVEMLTRAQFFKASLA